MKSLAERNITVVRAWAFHDVTQVPNSGNWIQVRYPTIASYSSLIFMSQLLSSNGTRTFNNGTNGAGRLRSIVSAARNHGMMVQFVLTNNWSAPSNISNVTITLQNGTKVNNPPGSYSNDYGGSDLYVAFQNGTDHGEFFTNNNVINSFVDGLTDLIPQFASEPNLLAWELANDARCNGTLQNSQLAGQCKTTVRLFFLSYRTIPTTHSCLIGRDNVAQYGRSTSQKIGPQSSCRFGVCPIPIHSRNVFSSQPCLFRRSQGFLCQTSQCPKLFFKTTPTPVASPAPGLRRRSLTEKSIIAERNARWKRSAEAAKRQQDTAFERRARGVFGRWTPRSLFGRDAAAVDSNLPSEVPRYSKRQVMTVGSAMDGSFGSDALDIAAVPE